MIEENETVEDAVKREIKEEFSVEIELLGGKLFIEWNDENNHIYMTGPAVTVFEGVLN